ncbi:hypothetical protein [Methylosinus sp. Sm6]|uniref:hypothetical protein n=1 Tax=Methylosinus sp. Sm6 TaxID=2866948 RepID=UPI001C9A2180|nr:hypothetical protein [Methylosinus sp. Sm6]MBY6242562.1 hypothetical protein [Methylosinus sp. Sm6]
MTAISIGALASAEEDRLPASGSPVATEPADPTVAKSDGAVATAPRTSDQNADAAQREYVRLLTAEVYRQARLQITVFADSVVVVFTVGASGRVTDYRLESATDRQQVEPVVRNIMAAIRTPPPPGGSFEARQEFRFGGMTRGRLPTDYLPTPPSFGSARDMWGELRFKGESRSGERMIYLRVMRSAVEKRRTKALTPRGVLAIFHVDKSGRVDRVKTARASDPEQAQIAHKLLYGLQAPPPPGGATTIKICFGSELDEAKRGRSPRGFCHAFKPAAN